MTTKEILESGRVSELIEAEIKKCSNRTNGKRTALDALKEKGLLSVEVLKKEFEKVMNRESDLPASQRHAVVDIVSPAWHRAFSELPNSTTVQSPTSESPRVDKGKVAMPVLPLSPILP